MNQETIVDISGYDILPERENRMLLKLMLQKKEHFANVCFSFITPEKLFFAGICQTGNRQTLGREGTLRT